MGEKPGMTEMPVLLPKLAGAIMVLAGMFLSPGLLHQKIWERTRLVFNDIWTRWKSLCMKCIIQILE